MQPSDDCKPAYMYIRPQTQRPCSKSLPFKDNSTIGATSSIIACCLAECVAYWVSQKSRPFIVPVNLSTANQLSLLLAHNYLLLVVKAMPIAEARCDSRMHDLQYCLSVARRTYRPTV